MSEPNELIRALILAITDTPEKRNALAHFWVRDRPYGRVDVDDIKTSILLEPYAVRLFGYQIGQISNCTFTMYGISLYFTESLRITDMFLVHTNNVEALAILERILAEYHRIFLCTWSNPVMRSFRCESPHPNISISFPRAALAREVISIEGAYISSLPYSTPGNFEAWKTGTRVILNTAFQNSSPDPLPPLNELISHLNGISYM